MDRNDAKGIRMGRGSGGGSRHDGGSKEEVLDLHGGICFASRGEREYLFNIGAITDVLNVFWEIMWKGWKRPSLYTRPSPGKRRHRNYLAELQFIYCSYSRAVCGRGRCLKF